MSDGRCNSRRRRGWGKREKEGKPEIDLDLVDRERPKQFYWAFPGRVGFLNQNSVAHMSSLMSTRDPRVSDIFNFLNSVEVVSRNSWHEACRVCVHSLACILHCILTV